MIFRDGRSWDFCGIAQSLSKLNIQLPPGETLTPPKLERFSSPLAHADIAEQLICKVQFFSRIEPSHSGFFREIVTVIDLKAKVKQDDGICVSPVALVASRRP